jgi:hypothetical protein
VVDPTARDFRRCAELRERRAFDQERPDRSPVKKATTAALVASLLLAWPALDLYRNGFSTEAACGFGFGERHRVVQEVAIRRMFLEPLPSAFQVVGVECSGFTDLTLIATFTVSQPEARQLVDALEATFNSPLHNAFVAPSQKHRRMIGPPSHTTYVYDLPGQPLFDVRTVSVTIPKDASAAATVVFNGGKY